MRILYLILSIGLFASGVSHANHRDISLTFPKGGYPPYLITNPKEKQKGILIDVLETITQELGFSLKIMHHPEVRGHLMVVKGQVDLFPSALEWVETPKRFLWTAPIMQVADNIITPKKNKKNPKTLDDLKGWKLGAFKKYYYPSLEPLFAKKHIERIDGRNLDILLKKLKNDYINAIVMDKNAFYWSLRHMEDYKADDFSAADLTIDSVGYSFMLTKNIANEMFVLSFNRILTQMKKDGRLVQIFKNYRN